MLCEGVWARNGLCLKYWMSTALFWAAAGCGGRGGGRIGLFCAGTCLGSGGIGLFSDGAQLGRGGVGLFCVSTWRVGLGKDDMELW